mmetsp:Transcript_75858/g.165461  ORF Transcript_75858/g.165461 Transcript_75858/m.165461 type:complete len:115 (+) Transcript_75858:178-522(+)
MEMRALSLIQRLPPMSDPFKKFEANARRCEFGGGIDQWLLKLGGPFVAVEVGGKDEEDEEDDDEQDEEESRGDDDDEDEEDEDDGVQELENEEDDEQLPDALVVGRLSSMVKAK